MPTKNGAETRKLFGVIPAKKRLKCKVDIPGAASGAGTAALLESAGGRDFMEHSRIHLK